MFIKRQTQSYSPGRTKKIAIVCAILLALTSVAWVFAFSQEESAKVAHDQPSKDRPYMVEISPESFTVEQDEEISFVVSVSDSGSPVVGVGVRLVLETNEYGNIVKNIYDKQTLTSANGTAVFNNAPIASRFKTAKVYLTDRGGKSITGNNTPYYSLDYYSSPVRGSGLSRYGRSEIFWSIVLFYVWLVFAILTTIFTISYLRNRKKA
jgi:hypothetical protein